MALFGVHLVAPQYGIGMHKEYGKPAAKPKAYHPKPNDLGGKVGLYDPHSPSHAASWYSPDEVATFVPGGEAPAALNGIDFAPWVDHPTDPESWDYVDGQDDNLDEPVVKIIAGKHLAAGVVIEEPDGRYWVVSPSNGYGGYKNTFPKGTIEDSMSLQASAIKEAFEESGLKVAITGFIGDYERTTSLTRYYRAVRVGGTPSDVGWESQAVHLVPADKMHSMLGMADRQILDDLGLT
jgi:ADP-ribose pyrophosphatase YjhB (NUDIX family)